jgi:hypothetical protein
MLHPVVFETILLLFDFTYFCQFVSLRFCQFQPFVALAQRHFTCCSYGDVMDIYHCRVVLPLINSLSGVAYLSSLLLMNIHYRCFCLSDFLLCMDMLYMELSQQTIMCKGTSALENYLVKDDTDTMYARGKLTS